MAGIVPRACLAVAALVCGSPDPPQASDSALLGRIRRHMADNLDRLPDYTCLETIERSVSRAAGRELLLNDRIRVEVAFIGRKEMFAWPGSATFQYSSVDEMVAGGASRYGAFGGWVHTLFRTSAPVFSYAREHRMDGRRTLRYDFRAPLLGSTYRVTVKGRGAFVPYSGSVWLDAEALDVVRVIRRVEDSGLAIASLSEVTGYASTRIGSAEFLLPKSSELTISDLEGNEYRNLMRFTACRQYSAQSSISFDTPRNDAPLRREEIQDVTLPAGLVLRIRLESPIASEQSAVGDQLTARLERAVDAGAISLPKGAKVSGRILRLEKNHRPEKYFIVGLEFSSLAFNGKRALFSARLVGPRLKIRERKDSTFYGAPPTSAGLEVSGLDIDDSSISSGAGVFRIWDRDLRLPRDLRMTWETTAR